MLRSIMATYNRGTCVDVTTMVKRRTGCSLGIGHMGWPRWSGFYGPPAENRGEKDPHTTRGVPSRKRVQALGGGWIHMKEGVSLSNVVISRA